MTTNATILMNETQTLAQRLAQGRIPAPDAERYSLILAEALRKIHEAGQIHGGVSPDSIMLTGSGLELGPAAHSSGNHALHRAGIAARPAAGSRSDMFAFGAVAYEMFSGRRAFEGDGEDALSVAIRTTMPPQRQSGDGPPNWQLLAKDPGTRWRRCRRS